MIPSQSHPSQSHFSAGMENLEQHDNISKEFGLVADPVNKRPTNPMEPFPASNENDKSNSTDDDENHDGIAAHMGKDAFMTSTPMVRKPPRSLIGTKAPMAASTIDVEESYAKPIYTAKYLLKEQNEPAPAISATRSASTRSGSSSDTDRRVSSASSASSISPSSGRTHDISSDRARVTRLTRNNPAFASEIPTSTVVPSYRSLTPDRPRSMYMSNAGPLPSSADRKPNLGSVHRRSPSYHGSLRSQSPVRRGSHGSHGSHGSIGSSSVNHLLFQSYSPDMTDETMSPLVRQATYRKRGAGGSRIGYSPSSSPILDRSLSRDRAAGDPRLPPSFSSLDRPGSRLSTSSAHTDIIPSNARASPAAPASLMDELEQSLQDELKKANDSTRTERQLEIVEMDIQQTRRTYQKLKERFELQVKLRENLAKKANIPAADDYGNNEEKNPIEATGFKSTPSAASLEPKISESKRALMAVKAELEQAEKDLAKALKVQSESPPQTSPPSTNKQKMTNFTPKSPRIPTSFLTYLTVLVSVLILTR